MGNKKPKPLPPGTYTGKIVKVRKKRNKPYYVITLNVNGWEIKERIPHVPQVNR